MVTAKNCACGRPGIYTCPHCGRPNCGCGGNGNGTVVCAHPTCQKVFTPPKERTGAVRTPAPRR